MQQWWRETINRDSPDVEQKKKKSPRGDEFIHMDWKVEFLSQMVQRQDSECCIGNAFHVSKPALKSLSVF